MKFEIAGGKSDCIKWSIRIDAAGDLVLAAEDGSGTFSNVLEVRRDTGKMYRFGAIEAKGLCLDSYGRIVAED